MIRIFKITALLEGTSYLLLLFIATPLKYLAENETYVKLLGMPHGILFIAYVLFAFMIRKRMQWNTKDFFIILLCSLIPFGTFWMDRKYLHQFSFIR